MPSRFQSTKPRRDDPLSYLQSLREHLAQPSTATLQLAQELGERAMDGGLEIFDLIRIHHQALAEGLAPKGRPTAPAGLAASLDSFLHEALSPFLAADGTQEHRIRTRLEHIEELALRNAELEDEIAAHKVTEAAMQASKDHYLELYQKARAMESDLRELSAQVLTAQEDERKRISRELHDEIGQALTAINVTIAMLKKQAVSDSAFQRDIADAERLLEHTMETVSSFARELRPAMLDHLGLQSALRAHLLAFTRQTGIKTELIAHPDLARLDERRAEVLFRVAQEALNNVYKHSGAASARIAFTATNDSLNMEIGDDGCAFDVDGQLGGKRQGRLGLLGMRERVRLVNGNFSIDSVIGNGTHVRVNIPLDAESGSRPGRTHGNAKMVAAFGPIY
ncbi:MAG: histidine kinase [Opitutaceae bacterium]